MKESDKYQALWSQLNAVTDSMVAFFGHDTIYSNADFNCDYSVLRSLSHKMFDKYKELRDAGK